MNHGVEEDRSPIRGFGAVCKRALDVGLSLAVLVLIGPVLILAALAVRTVIGRPAIFKQKRHGLDGREIVVWKFRTLTVAEDGNVDTQVTRDDPRLTRLGSLLRRTSFDELPQFVNVLQGRMSIVGPRPQVLAENEHFRKLLPGYDARHAVKPGITGWAQINGWRGEVDTLEKMAGRLECDLEYIRNWSVWLDLKIMAITCLRGLTGKNAY